MKRQDRDLLKEILRQLRIISTQLSPKGKAAPRTDATERIEKLEKRLSEIEKRLNDPIPNMSEEVL